MAEVNRANRTFLSQNNKQSGYGDALRGASNVVGNFAQQEIKKEKSLSDVNMANSLNNADREAMEFTNKWREQNSLNPLDESKRKDLDEGIKGIYNKWGENVGNYSKEEYSLMSNKRFMNYNLSNTEWGIGQNKKNVYTGLEQNVDTNLKQGYDYGYKGDLNGALKSFENSQEALEISSRALSPQEKARLLGSFQSDYMTKYMEGNISKNPYEAKKALNNKDVIDGINDTETVVKLREMADRRIKAMETQYRKDAKDRELRKLGLSDKEEAKEVAANLYERSLLFGFNQKAEGGVSNPDLRDIGSVVEFRNEIRKYKPIVDKSSYKKMMADSGRSLYQMAQEEYGLQEEDERQDTILGQNTILGFGLRQDNNVGSTAFASVDKRTQDVDDVSPDFTATFQSSLYEDTYIALQNEGIDMDSRDKKDIKRAREVSEQVYIEKMRDLIPESSSYTDEQLLKPSIFQQVKTDARRKAIYGNAPTTMPARRPAPKQKTSGTVGKYTYTVK